MLPSEATGSARGGDELLHTAADLLGEAAQMIGIVRSEQEDGDAFLERKVGELLAPLLRGPLKETVAGSEAAEML